MQFLSFQEKARIILIILLISHHFSAECMAPAQERFFIGIRLPVGLVDLGGVQNYIDQKIKQKVNGLGCTVTFTAEQWLHITIAEGTLDQGAKIQVDKYLKSISTSSSGWRKFKIHYKQGGDILGMPNPKFVVLTIDDQQPQSDMMALAKKIRNHLINMHNTNHSITIFHSNLPVLMHTTLGRISPDFNQLNSMQQQELNKIVKSLDPHDNKKAPIASASLNNFKVKELKFVVTPSNVFLTPTVLVNPQYVYGSYQGQ
jgi:hypothetical protein